MVWASDSIYDGPNFKLSIAVVCFFLAGSVSSVALPTGIQLVNPINSFKWFCFNTLYLSFIHHVAFRDLFSGDDSLTS